MWPSARPCLLLLGTFFALGCRDPLRPAESASLRAGFEALAEARRPAPLSVQTLSTVEGLRGALARGLDATGAALVTRTAGDALAVRISVVAEATTLDPDGGVLGHRLDRMAILLNGSGGFALNHALSWSLRADGEGEAGRRCWGVDGRWWVADAQGPLTEVPVLADEHLACARAPVALLTAPLLAWLDSADVVSAVALDRGATLLGPAGAPGVEVPAIEVPTIEVTLRARARVVDVDLSATPEVPSRFDEAPVAPDLASATPLAAHSRLVALDARLRFEPVSGALVDGALTVSAAFRKGPKVGRLNLAVRLRADTVDQAITAPQGAALAAPRPRIYRDLKTILGTDQGEAPPANDAGVALDLPAPGTAPVLALEAVGEGPLPATPEVDDEPLVPTAPPAAVGPPTPSLAEARFDIAPETADPAAEMSPHEDLP